MRTVCTLFKITSVAVLVILTGITFAQNKTGYSEMGLKDRVKSIKETQYKLNDVNPGLNEIILKEYSFNKNGQKTVETSNEVGKDLKTRHEISYDKSGRIASETEQNTDVNSNFTVRYKYEAGKLSKKELIANRKVISTYIYKYNEKGNVASMEIKKKLGLLDIYNEQFEYQYDDSCRLVEETHQDGKDYSKTEYRYDEKNRIVRTVEYNQRGGITYETDYEYDDFDNPSSEITKYRDRVIKNISYLYEYDSRGNWINKRSLADDKTYSLQIRIITYY
ncbi:MAG: hypothetical protein LBG92_06455 [Prevotellaceae bacterium]|jgi:YD repeat-containing protein|nr:hypothetical protein [Prevotellaceae bacterium]